MYTPLTIDKLDLGKKLMGLQDWVIQVAYHQDPPDEHTFGECEVESDWKRATVFIYLENLSKAANSYQDTVWGIYLHELGEVIAADCASHMREAKSDSADLMRMRDRLAEYIRNLVPRVAQITIEEFKNEDDEDTGFDPDAYLSGLRFG